MLIGKRECRWRQKPLEEAGYIGPEHIETFIEHVEEYGDCKWQAFYCKQNKKCGNRVK